MTKVTEMNRMFMNCTSLKSMKLNDFAVPTSTLNNTPVEVFYGVTGLTIKVDAIEVLRPNLKSTFEKLGFTSTTGTIQYNITGIITPTAPKF